MAGFAICEPVDKTDPTEREEVPSSKLSEIQPSQRKNAYYQADKNPAPPAREETEGREAKCEEIGEKAKLNKK